MAEETEEETFDAKVAFAALGETLSGVNTRLEAIEARFADEEEDAPPAEDEEMAALAAKVIELEDAATRLGLAVYDTTDDNIDRLVALKRSDAALFAGLVEGLAKKPATITLQPVIGNGGDGTENKQATLAAILDEAIKLGHDPSGANIVGWFANNHFDRMDELVAAGRAYQPEG
jgi:hypothetical protein